MTDQKNNFSFQEYRLIFVPCSSSGIPPLGLISSPPCKDENRTSCFSHYSSHLVESISLLPQIVLLRTKLMVRCPFLLCFHLFISLYFSSCPKNQFYYAKLSCSVFCYAAFIFLVRSNLLGKTKLWLQLQLRLSRSSYKSSKPQDHSNFY